MKYIIDRFEGKYAVCEDEKGNMVNIEKDRIAGKAVEGDVLVPHLDKYVVDEMETRKRREKIQALARELWSE